jgi:EAL domain-containing protein (putative c-di-GMP-specific phosphodiesterase class I)/GGDEF domain-containing protein
MLLSELEERGRRFKLALRAGVPILLLIALVAYAAFLKNDAIEFTTENSLLLGGITFITIYFIYFLLEQDAQESLLDHETHGFNQRAFEKKLKSSPSKTIALLIINNLPSINENYGAEETNKLLYHTIQRLNQSLKEDGLENAIIGRRYGAEFLIAMNEKRDDLKSALGKFVANNHVINSIDIEYKFSLMTYSNEELEKIIIHLKDELIESEECELDEPNAPTHKIQDISSISKIEDAIISSIERKQLSFLFRPLHNVKADKIDIYEVAVKLKSDTYGDILPKTYLPIVNRLGLGREYDFAIVHHLVKLLPLLDKSISLTFNISPFSLRNREFQTRLFDFLDKSDIDTSRLIIELYERKAHHDLSHYFQTLNYMRTKGLRIAIDNFGSSNASMEYMKHFRFDMVQFDRDYVTKLDDKITYEMLHSLIKMSKNLNITTIAKWVDKESQKTKLKTLGVDYIQGFGVGKPILEKELIDAYN